MRRTILRRQSYLCSALVLVHPVASALTALSRTHPGPRQEYFARRFQARLAFAAHHAAHSSPKEKTPASSRRLRQPRPRYPRPKYFTPADQAKEALSHFAGLPPPSIASPPRFWRLACAPGRTGSSMRCSHGWLRHYRPHIKNEAASTRTRRLQLHDKSFIDSLIFCQDNRRPALSCSTRARACHRLRYSSPPGELHLQHAGHHAYSMLLPASKASLVPPHGHAAAVCSAASPSPARSPHTAAVFRPMLFIVLAARSSKAFTPGQLGLEVSAGRPIPRDRSSARP